MYSFFIPLYAGIRGDLWECVRTTGEKITELHPIWITPGRLMEGFESRLGTIDWQPALHRYQGVFKFEAWDKRYQSTPKWVATIWIDADKKEYRIEMSERYRTHRYVVELFAHVTNRIPDANYAFFTNQPDGDWKLLDL